MKTKKKNATKKANNPITPAQVRVLAALARKSPLIPRRGRGESGD
jgi:hypothetical protein